MPNSCAVVRSWSVMGALCGSAAVLGAPFEVGAVCVGHAWCASGSQPVTTTGVFHQFELPSDFPPSAPLVSLLFAGLEEDSYFALEGSNLDGLAAPSSDEYSALTPLFGVVEFGESHASFCTAQFFPGEESGLAASLVREIDDFTADAVFIGRLTVVGGDGTIDIDSVEAHVRPVGFETAPDMLTLGTSQLEPVDAFGSLFSVYIHSHEGEVGTINDIYIISDPRGGSSAMCAEDVNGDGAIDTMDLNLVLFDFGCTECTGADVNLDGGVDSLDMNLVLFAFGTLCG